MPPYPPCRRVLREALRARRDLGELRRGLRLDAGEELGVGAEALGRGALLGEVLLCQVAAEGAQAGELEAVLAEEAVDLLHPLHLDVAPQRVALEAPLHGKEGGLGEAGVGHLARQADVVAEVDLAGDDDLAPLDDQEVGADRRLLLADVTTIARPRVKSSVPMRPVMRDSKRGGPQAATSSTMASGRWRVQRKPGAAWMKPTWRGWMTKAKRFTPAAGSGRRTAGGEGGMATASIEPEDRRAGARWGDPEGLARSHRGVAPAPPRRTGDGPRDTKAGEPRGPPALSIACGARAARSRPRRCRPRSSGR